VLHDEQKGFISPNISGAIYLVTISEGQYRMALLNRPSAGGLGGILLTLVADEGAQLTPAAVPISLTPVRSEGGIEVGGIREGHDRFVEYRDCVERVTQRGYARFPR
jgi:hypothetical protein